MSETNAKTILVWDIWTRLFHWSLVTIVFIQWFSMEIMADGMQIHEYAGYCLLALLIFRISWGLLGTKYARFSQFLYSPKTVINYAQSVTKKDSKPYSGHNPLGGLSVIAILFLLLAQVISGLFMTDDILFYGPYYDSVPGDVQKMMSQIHHYAFDGLLILIAIHLMSVIFYQLVKKQSLVQGMIHGKKQHETDSSISHHHVTRAIVLIAIAVTIVYLVVVYFAPETELYY